MVAFGLDGTQYELDPVNAPATPTLVLGPAEIDLTKIPDRSDWVNVTGPTGREIGNWSRPQSIMWSGDDCGLYAVEDCGDTSGGGGGAWVPPSDAVFTRDTGVREFIDQMWATNDHEPWGKGNPEFKLFFSGTNDTDGADELHESFSIPEDLWDGSNNDLNAVPRTFGPEYLRITDWYGYWGSVIGIK
jgi:hypothetical protein